MPAIFFIKKKVKKKKLSNVIRIHVNKNKNKNQEIEKKIFVSKLYYLSSIWTQYVFYCINWDGVIDFHGCVR